MYCIEKHIRYCSNRLKDVLRGYFIRDNLSTGFFDCIDDKYVNSEKGSNFLTFLKKINLTPADYTTNKKHINDIRTILKFLSYKSKFELKDWGSEYVRPWLLASVNHVIWDELTNLRTIHSSLTQYLFTKVKENPDYLGGQYLLYYWIMFEVQFRLTKAEKKIWDQGFDEFMQYVYGKIAILQAGN